VTDKPGQKQTQRQKRDERLAAQLRENLKKRKAQARARKSPGEDSGGENRQ
jgi:hypothetical protein